MSPTATPARVGGDYLPVGGRGELLFRNRGRLVPCLAEQCCATITEVFIQLQLHARLSIGTST